MEELETKTILAKVKPNDDFWYHHDYNMNLYRGCSHGCIYCDSRSDCYHVENFDTVRVKKDALKIFESELMKKRKKGIIGMGAMTDPYNPLEKKLEVTRGALLLIEKYGFGVSFATKSDLVLRDIDILERISKQHPVHVGFTITSADDETQKKIEPRVSTSSERFEAIRRLRDRGIHAGVMMMPILPFINDTEENVVMMVKKAVEAKAEYIFPWFGVTLRMNQRDYYYDRLDELFPGVKEKTIRRYGNRYACDVPNAKRLYAALDSACKEVGILTKIRDINEMIFPKQEPEQLSLF